MALDQNRLSQVIKASVESNPGGTTEEGIQHFADTLAAAIVNEIKLATVVVAPGQVVQVVPATGTGSTTTPGTATIT